jgi:hypothetical protein
MRVEGVESEGDVAVSEEGLEPAYQLERKAHVLENCRQSVVVVYVVEEHTAYQTTCMQACMRVLIVSLGLGSCRRYRSGLTPCHVTPRFVLTWPQ